MIITTIYLYTTLLIQAPETLVRPSVNAFSTEQAYQNAVMRFEDFGRWNS